MAKDKLQKDFEKAQLDCVKKSMNKDGSWNSEHFIYCKADLLNVKLIQREDDYEDELGFLNNNFIENSDILDLQSKEVKNNIVKRIKKLEEQLNQRLGR